MATAGVGVGVSVGAQAVCDFLVDAHGAAHCTAADAGVVEGRVVRAETTSTAVPQRRHCGCGIVKRKMQARSRHRWCR